MLLVGNIGEGCNANTEISTTLISCAIVTHSRRNSQMRECNSATSVRHPERMKMYAELKRNKKLKKLEIKNFNGNKLKLFNKKPCNSARVKLDPVKYLDCV